MTNPKLFCLASTVFSLANSADAVPPKLNHPQFQLDYASEPCSPSTNIQGLMVILHGKGGHSNYALLAKEFAAISCHHKLLPVAVRAPSWSLNNWPFETRNGEGQDLALDELAGQVLPKNFKTTPKKVAFVGISAGATFLMGDFVPLHGYKYKGVAIALCGGGFPFVPKINQPQLLAKFLPLYLQISKNDFLYSQSIAGVAVYKKNGVSPFVQITSENGHCAFDMKKALDNALTMFLR